VKANFKILSIAILCFILGCGYKTGSLLPSHLNTIYVENFLNKIDVSKESSDRFGYRIYRSALESDITTEVIDRFIFDGNLTIVDEENADLILKGTLIDYAREPLRYDKFDNVEEYRLFISVNLKLIDAVEGEKTLWTELSFTGESTYRTSGALSKSEETALDEVIEDLAKRIVERTTEGW